MSNDPETVKTLARWQAEADRLKTLSNEDLVKEHMNMDCDADDELITNEMYHRLWPDWLNQEL